MKRSIIVSLIVMALCVVVGVVGITAAWFGDTLKRDDSVIVSSYAPTGNATMSIDSTSDFTSGEGLRPAIATAGYILGQRNGTLNLDSIDVLDNANVTAGYITQTATQVTMDFDFAYAGTADAGFSNKAIAIKLTSVTLQNPRVYITVEEYRAKYHGNPRPAIRYTYDETEQKYIQNDTGEYARDYLQLDDYKSEFNFDMGLAKYFESVDYDGAYAGRYYVRTGIGINGFEMASPQPTESTFKAEGAPKYYHIDDNATYNWSHHMMDNYTLYILATPRVEAKFSFTVNFARVDEETSPILRNAKLFFNFEVDVTQR